MSTLGVIVEYNPLHNGHLYHLQQAKKITNADTTIAVMSGSFLQRGEPAIVDKWTRTNMALSQGIDLVVELPVIYSTQAADWFAFGSTSLLHHLKVDHFVFGSEAGSIAPLHRIADVLLEEPPLLKKHLKESLSLGHSYPKAVSLSLQRYLEHEAFQLSKPNDILGLQYIYHLKKMNSPIAINTVKRHAAQYHDQDLTSQTIASATAIRKRIFTNKKIDDIEAVVPKSTFILFHQACHQNRINAWENFFNALKIIILGKDYQQLQEIHGMVEGFERRVKDLIIEADTFEAFVQLLKTKRYTMTKIQRTLLYILLDLTASKVKKIEVEKGPQYIRILGFTEKGRSYLNKIKHDLELPLITNIPRDKSPMLELDIAAANIYETGFQQPATIKMEYKQAPIYLR